MLDGYNSAATLLAAICTIVSAGAAHAGEPSDMLGGKFDYNLLIQGYAEGAEVAGSNANPGNQLANLPERVFLLDLRPNLHFANGMLDLRVSPRAQVQQNQVGVDDIESRHQTTSAFINEWGVRVIPDDAFALSVGREVLLWGPAQSYSPSNPFYTDNGRSHPYVELGGKDFFKVTWFPSHNWTLNYIDNIGQGTSVLPPLESFHRTRVLKFDYTGQEVYWGVNYAWKDGRPPQIGFSIQDTVSDALLAYAEGGYSRGRTQYRPQPDGNGGWQLAAPDGNGGLSGLSVLGLAYTLSAGPTVTAEYLYNNQGWDSKEANSYLSLTQDAAQTLAHGGPPVGNAILQLARGSQPGSVLQRRHYLFLQYNHLNLITNLDFTVRLTRSFDDNSITSASIFEWRVGDRYKLFALGVFNGGGVNTEFGSYVAKQLFIGLNASF